MVLSWEMMTWFFTGGWITMVHSQVLVVAPHSHGWLRGGNQYEKDGCDGVDSDVSSVVSAWMTWFSML